jgi:hypothetical protein
MHGSVLLSFNPLTHLLNGNGNTRHVMIQVLQVEEWGCELFKPIESWGGGPTEGELVV